MVTQHWLLAVHPWPKTETDNTISGTMHRGTMHRWRRNASWPRAMLGRLRVYWASLLMTSEGVREATSTGGNRTRAHIYWGNRAFRFGTWKNWSVWIKIWHCKRSQKVHVRAIDLNLHLKPALLVCSQSDASNRGLANQKHREAKAM